MRPSDRFAIEPVAVIRSVLTRLEDAPMQGYEGAPDAWVEVEPAFVDALDGLGVGDQIVLLTWFHLADRDVLKVHPRSDPSRPLAGVFATRSPDRANPIGLHRVTVLAIEGGRLHVQPLEAIDGTPVIDIKPVLPESNDA